MTLDEQIAAQLDLLKSNVARLEKLAADGRALCDDGERYAEKEVFAASMRRDRLAAWGGTEYRRVTDER